VVAVACFLVLPLRFTFERPEPTGLFGGLFTLLESFDQPFNQAPSLHIALLVILWQVYLRAVPRAWHVPLHASFCLIGVSVLTTWQHHFIDVPTGAWLGWFCVWLHPDDGRSPLTDAHFTCDRDRRKLAFRYASGALACMALAIAGGGGWLWVAWAAGSLVLVAVIYAAGSTADLQKRRDGSIAPAAWWLMGPYFLGAWLNSRWWTRNIAAAHPVAPGVFLGRIPTRTEIAHLGIAAIVDLSAELPCPAGSARYINVPVLDLTALSVEQTERAVTAIEAAREHGPVLVCCALGYSRSAAAVVAWLIRSGRSASLDAAIVEVRRVRPVVLTPTSLDALGKWQARSTT